VRLLACQASELGCPGLGCGNPWGIRVLVRLSHLSRYRECEGATRTTWSSRKAK
jgi:hypothetical protein